jgi:RNA polymerase sigma factor (TIGR02999 family)
MDEPVGDVTEFLNAVSRGDAGAEAALIQRIYADLRGIAREKLTGRAGQSLHPTDLVHEAYVRVFRGADSEEAGPRWENRRHFFFAAARAMRDVVVEKARRRASLKRGDGWERTELDELAVMVEDPRVDVLELDEALERLAKSSPLRAELVQLRYFAGLTMEQAADVLGISRRSAFREWRFVRALLFDALGGDPANDPDPSP